MAEEIRIVYVLVLALTALERLAELKRSERNARWALQLGGIEYGQEFQRRMKLMPAALLMCSATEVIALDRPFEPIVGVLMFMLVVMAQIIRWSSIHALGRLWTNRIIVVPGIRPVTDGPYRWTRHPDSLAMMIEAIAIPMMHGAWMTALLFFVLNAIVLRSQTRTEEASLAQHSDYAVMMKERGRIWPRFQHAHHAAVAPKAAAKPRPKSATV